MLASEYTEFGWILVALILIVGAGFLIRGGRIRKVSLDAGPVHARMDMQQISAQLTQIANEVADVGKSVNHQAPGEPLLIEWVKQLAKEAAAHQKWQRTVFRWQSTCIEILGREVGANLPPCLDCDEPVPVERRQGTQLPFEGLERRRTSPPQPTEGEQ